MFLVLLPSMIGAAQRAIPGQTICGAINGCVAAYSAQRRMVPTYTGPLFQLKKTGGSSQDIGQTPSGKVDLAAITSFCGTVAGSGTSTTTTNNCVVHIIYDHTANANHMTAIRCDSPYAVNARGLPVFINTTTDGTCYYGNNTPTGTPTGNANITLYVAANDVLRTVDDSSTAVFGYGIDFGMMHDTTVANTAGSSFDLIVRGGAAGEFTGVAGYLTFGVDLETDVVELPYGTGDGTSAEFALTPNLASFGAVGDFVGTATYNTSTTAIVVDFNVGQRTFSTTYPSVNMGGGSLAEIREGHTGDDSGTTPGAWYEGAIYATTLTLGQQRSLEANGQAFYQVTSTPSCMNAPRPGGVDVLGGSTVVTGAWGLRQLDPNGHSPIAIIDRVSDNALKVIGTVKGTCDLDVATANTFCNATTCHVYALFNQVMPIGQNRGWPLVLNDYTRMTSGGSFTSGPTLTFNGLGPHPVMTFASGSSLSAATNSVVVTRPWSLLAAVTRTNASGGAFFTAASGTEVLGAATSNTLMVQSGSGTWTTTNADNTWHAVAGMVPTSTSLMACSNGTCTTSGTVSTADASFTTLTLGTGGFTGAMTEIYLINSTAVSSAQVAALSLAQRAYWGF